jgi:hypothetical protein
MFFGDFILKRISSAAHSFLSSPSGNPVNELMKPERSPESGVGREECLKVSRGESIISHFRGLSTRLSHRIQSTKSEVGGRRGLDHHTRRRMKIPKVFSLRFISCDTRLPFIVCPREDNRRSLPETETKVKLMTILKWKHISSASMFHRRLEAEKRVSKVDERKTRFDQNLNLEGRDKGKRRRDKQCGLC